MQIDSLLLSRAERSNLNRDMCKFERSQKDKSRAQSADSSKECRKPSAFKCVRNLNVLLGYCHLSVLTKTRAVDMELRNVLTK